MAYRQTFVIEYPDASHAPAVGADMEMLVGKLIACQFNDALEELEALHECCSPDDISRAMNMRANMEANRTKAEPGDMTAPQQSVPIGLR